MRIAIIGAGRMGRRHIAAVRAESHDLVAIMDASTAALDEAARAHEIPELMRFQDLDALLAGARPDCVIVATTTPSHADYVLRSVRAGVRAILCEKPMASSLAQCDAMIAACREAGARFAINHPMRYTPQYVEAKRLAADDELGGLRSLTVIAPNVGLAMNGSHCFEILRFVTGCRIREVAGWIDASSRRDPRGAQYVDHAGCVHATTTGDHRFYLDAAADRGAGWTAVYACRNGLIVVDEMTGQMTVTSRAPEHRAKPTTMYGAPTATRTLTVPSADATELARCTLRALIDGGDHPTGQDGRDAVAALVAAHVSSESGHAPVAIDRGLPVERTFQWP